MIIADIPGLIEGAHTGLGLGDRFLKHVERTRFLVHILSAQDINKNDYPFAGFDLINEELRLFDPELSKRKQIEVINKIDLLSEEELKEIRELARKEKRRMFFISAKEGTGLEELVREMWKLRGELELNEALIHYQEDELLEMKNFLKLKCITYGIDHDNQRYRPAKRKMHHYQSRFGCPD